MGQREAKTESPANSVRSSRPGMTLLSCLRLNQKGGAFVSAAPVTGGRPPLTESMTSSQAVPRALSHWQPVFQRLVDEYVDPKRECW